VLEYLRRKNSRVAKVDSHKWDCREIRKIANTPLEGSKDSYIIGDFQHSRLIDNDSYLKYCKILPIFFGEKKEF